MAKGQITLTDLNDGGGIVHEYSLGSVTSPGVNWTNSVPSITSPDQCIWMRVGTIIPPATSPTSWDNPIRLTSISAITGFLTNESHAVAAAADGTGYSLVTAGGNFKVYSGTTDVTAECTFSGTTTKSGLTLTISSAGVYSLSGPSWTSNSETFTLNATYNGVTISKVYTITKSLAGADAEIYELKINPTNLVRGRDGALSPSYLTLSATKTVGNGTPEDYVGLFEIYEDGVINPSGPFSPVSPATSINYIPTTSTVKQIQVELYTSNGQTLLDTQGTMIINDGATGKLLYTDEWVVNPDTEITSSSFEHWSPVINMDEDELLNNVIINTDGPHGTSVPVWKMTVLNEYDWVSTSSTDFLIDNTKKYRFTIWFKKVGTDLEDGSIYLGTKAYGVLSLTDTNGVPERWSYFAETDSSALNEWHLLVAHIHPYTSETVSLDSASGIYNIKGEKTNLEITDFKWPVDQLSSLFRFGYGYNTIQQEVYFYAPRVDLCDGNELPLDGFFPSLNRFALLQELFQNFEDDGQISPVEKRSLKELWHLISSDYAKVISEANIADLNSEDFENAYNALSHYLMVELAIFENMEEATLLIPNSPLTETEYWETTWENYYLKKEELEASIRDYNLDRFNSQQILIGEATSAVSNAQGDISVIKSYMHYDSEGLTFSKDNSVFQITISNDQIEFKDGDALIAYINGQKMYIESLEVLQSILLGNHKIEKLQDTPSTLVRYAG